MEPKERAAVTDRLVDVRYVVCDVRHGDEAHGQRRRVEDCPGALRASLGWHHQGLAVGCSLLESRLSRVELLDRISPGRGSRCYCFLGWLPAAELLGYLRLSNAPRLKLDGIRLGMRCCER